MNLVRIGLCTGIMLTQLLSGCKEMPQGIYESVKYDESQKPTEFWNPNHVIFTFYFSNETDTQRNTSWSKNDYKLIKPWHESMEWHKIRGIIFHDGVSDEFIEKHQRPNIEFVYTPNHKRYDIYTHRFVLVLEYLKQHPEIEYAFLTDGSDVLVKSNPFKNIQKDMMYVGSEPQSVAATRTWLSKQLNPLFNYNAEQVEGFMQEYGHLPLLNAGISGGHRDIFIEFLEETERVSEPSAAAKDATIDMAAFNLILYGPKFKNRFKTGEPVHSKFKDWEVNRNDVFFIHK